MSQNIFNHQVQRMIAFMNHEAAQRAADIDGEADGEYAYEKGVEIQRGRRKIQEYYRKKRYRILREDIIVKSEYRTQQKMRLLTVREAHVSNVEAEVQRRIIHDMKDARTYRLILFKLILQGICMMLDTNVILRVQKCDLKLVSSLLKEVEDKFLEMSKINCHLTIDKEKFLPPSSLGGVEISTQNGRTFIDNTIFQRLKYIIHDTVPLMRTQLFCYRAHSLK